jgi:hypothetical protein
MKLKSDYPVKMLCDLFALPRGSWPRDSMSYWQIKSGSDASPASASAAGRSLAGGPDGCLHPSHPRSCAFTTARARGDGFTMERLFIGME